MKLNWMRDKSGKISWKKILLSAALATGVVLGALILLISFRGGTVIKTAVNTMGGQFLGVPVSVSDVSFYPLTGKVSLRDLVISNPEGYKSDYLFKMGELDVSIAMLDLLRGKVHIRQIIVGGPHVIYDKKLTTSNVNDLLKILEEKYPAPKDDEKDEKKDAGDEAAAVVIDELVVREGKVNINLVGSLPLPLAEFRLKDVGKDGAMLPGQIVAFVFKQLIYSVIKTVGGVAGLAVDGVVGGAKAIGGGVKAIGSGIASIFTSDDSDEKESAKDSAQDDKKE